MNQMDQDLIDEIKALKEDTNKQLREVRDKVCFMVPSLGPTLDKLINQIDTANEALVRSNGDMPMDQILALIDRAKESMLKIQKIVDDISIEHLVPK